MSAARLDAKQREEDGVSRHCKQVISVSLVTLFLRRVVRRHTWPVEAIGSGGNHGKRKEIYR